jgi:hypothetical protein
VVAHEYKLPVFVTRIGLPTTHICRPASLQAT